MEFPKSPRCLFTPAHAGDLVFLGDRRRWRASPETPWRWWRPGAHPGALSPILEVPTGRRFRVASPLYIAGTYDVRARVQDWQFISLHRHLILKPVELRWTLRPGCSRRRMTQARGLAAEQTGVVTTLLIPAPLDVDDEIWQGSSEQALPIPYVGGSRIQPVQFERIGFIDAEADSVGVGRSASAQSGSPSNRSDKQR